jgi:hypothetical protein
MYAAQVVVTGASVMLQRLIVPTLGHICSVPWRCLLNLWRCLSCSGETLVLSVGGSSVSCLAKLIVLNLAGSFLQCFAHRSLKHTLPPFSNHFNAIISETQLSNVMPL